MKPHSLLTIYQRSGQILLANLDGLTPVQAFWSPMPTVNSIHWLLGHIISARTNPALAVGQKPVWDDATRARYRNGSEPISGEGEGVLELMRLVFDFAESQRRLEMGLLSLSADDLDGPAKFPQFASVGDQLLYHHTHEMHHIGQAMLLRDQLGMSSVWV